MDLPLQMTKSHIKVIFWKPCYEDELQELGYSLGANDDYEAIAMGLRKKVVELN